MTLLGPVMESANVTDELVNDDNNGNDDNVDDDDGGDKC